MWRRGRADQGIARRVRISRISWHHWRRGRHWSACWMATRRRMPGWARCGAIGWLPSGRTILVRRGIFPIFTENMAWMWTRFWMRARRHCWADTSQPTRGEAAGAIADAVVGRLIGRAGFARRSIRTAGWLARRGDPAGGAFSDAVRCLHFPAAGLAFVARRQGVDTGLRRQDGGKGQQKCPMQSPCYYRSPLYRHGRRRPTIHAFGNTQKKAWMARLRGP